MAQKDDIFDGTVVYTDFQSTGRGQRGNQWESERGQNLLFSIYLKTDFIMVNEQFLLNLAISIGILKALPSFGNFQIKWPNDLIANRKKICGILIENQLNGSRLKQSIIGIGVNIHQIAFNNASATSLASMFPDQIWDRKEVLERILENIEYQIIKIKNKKTTALFDTYYEHLLGFGKEAAYIINGQEVKGIIEGVDEYGKLRIQIERQTQSFGIKEIQFKL